MLTLLIEMVLASFFQADWRSDVGSFFWCTYRKGFPAMAPYAHLTSDRLVRAVSRRALTANL